MMGRTKEIMRAESWTIGKNVTRHFTVKVGVTKRHMKTGKTDPVGRNR